MALDSVAHDLLVLVVGLIVVLLVDPVNNAADGFNNGVVVVSLEVWEIGDVTTLVEEWSIDEMPFGLIRATLVFNVISESGALDKRVFTLEMSPRWIRSLEHAKDLLNLTDGGLIK